MSAGTRWARGEVAGGDEGDDNAAGTRRARSVGAQVGARCSDCAYGHMDYNDCIVMFLIGLLSFSYCGVYRDKPVLCMTCRLSFYGIICLCCLAAVAGLFKSSRSSVHVP